MLAEDRRHAAGVQSSERANIEKVAGRNGYVE
jgi:hypothetical protein